MKVTVQKEETKKVVAQQNSGSEVHPLRKHYYIVSKKAVDYENLSAFEAVSMSAVFLLALTAGVITSLNVA